MKYHNLYLQRQVLSLKKLARLCSLSTFDEKFENYFPGEELAVSYYDFEYMAATFSNCGNIPLRGNLKERCQFCRKNSQKQIFCSLRVTNEFSVKNQVHYINIILFPARKCFSSKNQQGYNSLSFLIKIFRDGYDSILLLVKLIPQNGILYRVQGMSRRRFCFL